jgi:tryptophanyl-tRNA synthetase
MLLATGIDPERSVVFLQNHVSAHAEAALLLAASTTFGESPPHDAVQREALRPRLSFRRRCSPTRC